MSIATSQKSEPTVLLWGDRWWLPQHKLPVPFPDIGRAAEVLASVWPFPTKSFRLVYQPDRLATAPVKCPNGNRATLALALGDEHPALLHPAHVWSHEPILSGPEGFSTLLHFETEPGLFGLVQQLQHHGLTARSAWPMTTWLNALPPELSESGALTVVALHTDRYSIYRHSAAGGRLTHAGAGGDVVGAIAKHLKDVVAHAESEYVLYVTTDDALLAEAEVRVGLKPNQILGVHSLWEALAKPAVFPEKHPAQLLPPVPFVTPARLAGIATSLLLAISLSLGIGQARAHQLAQEQAVERARAVAGLHEEIRHLRANSEEILRLRSGLSDSPGLSRVPELLRTLGSAAQSGIALQQLEATAEGFRIQGGVASDASKAWATWSGRLAKSAWTLAPTAPNATGLFEVRGTFAR